MIVDRRCSRGILVAIALVVLLRESNASAATPAVRYTVSLTDADRSVGMAAVTVDIARAPATLSLTFAPWLPGAYELRLFGREVRGLAASQAGKPLVVRRDGAGLWEISGHDVGAAVQIRYRIAASLLSDDGADFDKAHAYLNPGAVLPRVNALAEEPHAIAFVDLPAGWQLYSVLATPGARSWSAASYARLCDAPVEATLASRVGVLSRVLSGARFDIVADEEGASIPPRLPPRLLDDLGRIVAAERALAGPLPFARYLVLVHLSDRPGRNVALEHAASTSLVLSRSDLRGAEGYAAFLHMLAHELFHAWNARRLVPREASAGPLETSAALWITEGLTEHVSVVAERRAGVLSQAALGIVLSEALTRARATEAAHLSLADLSMLAGSPPLATAADPDAYYAAGHAVSLALTAELLTRSDGRMGLEELLAGLLPTTTAAARTIDLEGLGRVVDSLVPASEPPLSSLLAHWVNAPFSLDALLPSLERIGLGVREEASSGSDTSAIIEGSPPVIRLLPPGGAWLRAGARAGDQLLTLDETPVTAESLTRIITGHAPVGQPVRVEVERAGVRLRFVLAPESRPPVVLVDSDAWARPTGGSRAARMRLLGEPARRP